VASDDLDRRGIIFEYQQRCQLIVFVSGQVVVQFV